MRIAGLGRGFWSALLMGMILCGQAATALPSAEPLRSGCEVDYPPFCIVHEDGRADGFAVELMRAALVKMGREVTFRTGPWVEVRGWLERGEVDALPLVGRTPEREKLFDFTVPYMTMYGAIVVRNDTTDVHSLADLHGRRVGVMAGDNAEEFLRREDRGFEIVTAPTFTDAFQALAEGRCDAVVVQRLVAIRLLEETGLDSLQIIDRPIMDFSQDWCFAVTEGDRETLAMLNEGLALTIADGTHRRLHAKWFASLQLPSDRPIVIGGDHNYPPFEFLDEKGRPAGYNVDLVLAIADATGLDIRIRLGEWTATMRALERGEIDAIMGMGVLNSSERNETFDFSQAHLVNHGVAVTRKEDGPPPSALADLSGKRIVVQDGDSMHEFCRLNGLTNQLTLVGSQKQALHELAEGKHDCALVARMAAYYWIDRKGWDRLAVGRTSLVSPDYGFAVPKGQRALLAQLSEGLTAIAHSGEYKRIQEKWMGVYEAQTLWRNALKVVAWVAGPLLLIALLALLWSWELRKQVATRTRELWESTEELARQFRLLRVAGKTTRFGGWSVDLATNTCTWSDIVAKIHGMPHGFSPKMEEGLAFYASEWRDKIKQVFTACAREGIPFDEEMEIVTRSGERVWIRIAGEAIWNEEGRIVQIQGSLQDISRQKAEHEAVRRIEAQLRQAQKMESVGRLAGGVAHDFNNMIMGIMGYAELCRDAIDADHPAHEWLAEIMREAERSAKLTRQLLAFARKQTVAPKVLDLNDAVASMLKMLRRLIGEDIHLLWETGAALWSVKIDPGQIDQILANLCVNARDAIGGTGKITIETENVSIDSDYCAEHVEAAPGAYVMLAVSDNGCGMDRETIASIFEPFFTTKGIGEGTGLGLATVYGIVKQNGGFVNVYSELNKGTTFRIYLPRVEDVKTATAADATAAACQGGTETILLVEDEKSIRVTMCVFLEQFGYTVLPADGPEAALPLAAAHNGTIDLLITDVVMPGMSGRELAEKLAADRPSMKVLYMSGYTADVIAHRGILEDGVQFMSKPVSRDALARKVREVLA